MAERLYVEKIVNDRIVSKIDDSQILGLDIHNSECIELFMFAAAVGLRMGVRTPLRTKHGFIRNTSVPAEKSSLMFSLLVNEMRANNTEDKISDLDEAQTIIQEYANTGFYEIEKWIDQFDGKIGTEQLELILLDRILDVDAMYTDIFGEAEA